VFERTCPECIVFVVRVNQLIVVADALVSKQVAVADELWLKAEWKHEVADVASLGATEANKHLSLVFLLLILFGASQTCES
jgi:hypothetical protein